MRNALTSTSQHRKTEHLWISRTPLRSCCTPDLTHPTKLHAPYTPYTGDTCVSRRAIWMKWKIFGYAPPSPLRIKCLSEYFSVTTYFGTPPLPVSFEEL